MLKLPSFSLICQLTIASSWQAQILAANRSHLNFAPSQIFFLATALLPITYASGSECVNVHILFLTCSVVCDGISQLSHQNTQSMLVDDAVVSLYFDDNSSFIEENARKRKKKGRFIFAVENNEPREWIIRKLLPLSSHNFPSIQR